MKEFYFDVIAHKYANFHGVASKREYWMFFLYNTLSILALWLLSFIFSALLAGINENDADFSVIFFNVIIFLCALFLQIPSIAIAVRRLRDAGYGWYMILLPITGIGAFVLLYFLLQDSETHKDAFSFQSQPQTIPPTTRDNPVKQVVLHPALHSTVNNSTTQSIPNKTYKTMNQVKESESLFSELLKKCRPDNFMEPYDAVKVSAANSLYDEILKNEQNDEILKKIRQDAIDRLGVVFSSEKIFNYLKNKYFPKKYMDPYDKNVIDIVNDIYSRVIKNSGDVVMLENIEKEAESNSILNDYALKVKELEDKRRANDEAYLKLRKDSEIAKKISGSW